MGLGNEKLLQGVMWMVAEGLVESACFVDLWIMVWLHHPRFLGQGSQELRLPLRVTDFESRN